MENVLSEDLVWEVEESLKAVKPDSSPGVPWLAFGNTNEQVLLMHRDLIVDATVQRLEMLLAADPDELVKLTAEELVQQGYCDPVRVFVKNEPHTLEKVKQGRFRLIFSVSLVDQLVERVFAWRQNGAEISMWEDIPSKPGIGFTDDMVKAVWDSVNPWLLAKILCETDISGYDFSWKDWLLWAEGEMRSRLGACPRMQRLIRNRFLCIGLSVLVLSDGRMFAQLVRAWMKSGCYITGSSNSRSRVLLAEIIGALCIAMGDDSLETYVPDAAEKYRKLGFQVKMYTVCEDSFEFCSHRYKDGKAHPESWPRTLFRLLNQGTKDSQEKFELYSQFLMEMRHHPRLAEMVETISRVGWFLDSSSEGKNGGC